MKTLSSDLAVLTTIPEKAIDKFFTKIKYCIVEAVHEAQIAGDDMAEIDLGYGTLYIKIIRNDLKYKFEPSHELAKTLEETLYSNRNILQDILNETLVNKFVNVYKDICD